MQRIVDVAEDMRDKQRNADREPSAGSSTVCHRILSIVISPLALVAGGFIVVSSMVLVFHCRTQVPFEDQWDELISIRSVSFTWLLQQHNEHRIFVARLFFLLDYLLSAETGTLNLLSNVAIQAAMVSILSILASHHRSMAFRVAVIGFVATMCFWSVQWQNLTWGFQVEFFGVILGATTVFALVVYAPRTAWGLATIVLATAITVYALASGILAALIAPVLGAYIGRSRRDVIAMSATAAVLIRLYLIDYIDSPREGIDPLLQSQGRAIATHFVAGIGGPVGTAFGVLTGGDPIAVAASAGIAGVIFAAAMLSLAYRAPFSRTRTVLVGLLVFAGSSVALTAYGRAGFGAGQALESRYATPALTFWTAACLLALSLAAGARQRWRVGAWGLPAAFMTLAVATQGEFDAHAQALVAAREELAPALLARVYDRPRLQLIKAHPDIAFADLDALKAAHTAIFASDDARWMGDALSSHITTIADRPCGAVSTSEPVGEMNQIGWRVSGMINGGTTGRILLVDPAGKIVGYGGPATTPGAWVGYVAGNEPFAVTPYVITGAGAVCPMPASDLLFDGLVPTEPLPAGVTEGGYIDAVTLGHDIVISGWTATGRDRALHDLVITSDLPIERTLYRRFPRPDVVKAMHDPRLIGSGFEMRISFKAGAVLPQNPRICLWTVDRDFGSRLLVNPSYPEMCRDGKV